MGGFFSIYKEDGSRNAQMDEADSEPTSTKLVKHPKRKRTPVHITNTPDSDENMGNKYDQVQSLDGIVEARRKKYPQPTILEDERRLLRNEDEYNRQRDEIKNRESALSWDYLCRRDATQDERNADKILQALRWGDEEIVYGRAQPLRGYQGQEHPRFMGDHFLSNVELINRTRLFDLARKVPKGAHLHIHFNANLLPNVLLGIAAKQPRMFITSDRPLTSSNLDQAKLQFMILSEDAVKKRVVQYWMARYPGKSLPEDKVLLNLYPAGLFDKNYPMTDAKDASFRPPMKFTDFRANFDRCHRMPVDKWLEEKLMFHAEEVHGMPQTADGAWDRFNTRTQMMKGLFNYDSAYRQYTQACLQEFVDDNILYAELRVNFMHTNQLFSDDGMTIIKNPGIMKIIVEECQEFMARNKRFAGVKVIYCAPRSFEDYLIRNSLEECLEFKVEWPNWIAGFDLVGEESKGRSLRDHVPLLLGFKKACQRQGVDIPFIFHCGETLDVGNDVDGNLYDALLLGAKRIGHGFALARHPYIMEQMKKANVCLELCPISNEILGLTPRANGHAMYNLLANNVHCTVNTDNGTLFRSRLSHDFYQLFAGKKDMNLFGWKQLAIWSIEHSCMNDAERKRAMAQWQYDWAHFIKGIVSDSGNQGIAKQHAAWLAQRAEEEAERRKVTLAKMDAEDRRKAIEAQQQPVEARRR